VELPGGQWGEFEGTKQGLAMKGLEVDPALASALISMVEICTAVK
jgi:hypothetical protein